jgi:hypothetical protein
MAAKDDASIVRGLATATFFPGFCHFLRSRDDGSITTAHHEQQTDSHQGQQYANQDQKPSALHTFLLYSIDCL